MQDGGQLRSLLVALQLPVAHGLSLSSRAERGIGSSVRNGRAQAGPDSGRGNRSLAGARDDTPPPERNARIFLLPSGRARGRQDGKYDAGGGADRLWRGGEHGRGGATCPERGRGAAARD